MNQKRILLGVTGSIAAYKSASLASQLTQAGIRVDALLTASASRFITPLTFQSVTGRKAYTDSDLWNGENHVLHVELARHADLMIIAPATANTIAKLAHGTADDLLCLTALSADCPILIAPAMETQMFQHAATQANLKLIKERGVKIIGPYLGRLASGASSVGRMVEPEELFKEICYLLSRNGPLKGIEVVITAGGTQEPIDPVRVITNRSSGKQGFALAQAALDAGAEVTLIAGPASLAAPQGAKRIDVQKAEEMLEAVLKACKNAHVLIMAAAVADFSPSRVSSHKLKKEKGFPAALTLKPTQDILIEVARQRKQLGRPEIVLGFAAETENLIENAMSKLKTKSLSLIAVNDVSASDAGFCTETNRVTLIGTDGNIDSLPLMTKAQVAQKIIEKVIFLIETHRKNKKLSLARQ